jgi:hypothetical protein
MWWYSDLRRIHGIWSLLQSVEFLWHHSTPLRDWMSGSIWRLRLVCELNCPCACACACSGTSKILSVGGLWKMTVRLGEWDKLVRRLRIWIFDFWSGYLGFNENLQNQNTFAAGMTLKWNKSSCMRIQPHFY